LSESDRILKTALLLRIDFPTCSNINILFRCLSRKAVVAIGANKKSELAIGDFAEQLLKLTWI